MFDLAVQEIPEGLHTMPPGPELSAALASIDVAKVRGYDRVVVLEAHQRMVSHHAAHAYEAMTAIVDLMPDDDPEWAAAAAAAEIRCALHLTRRATDMELLLALDLRDRLPSVWSLLEAGRIDVRRAKAIVRSTEHLSIARARDVVDRVIDDAPELTTGQLQTRLRRLAMETDPEDARHRYDTAVEDRRIVTQPTTDGTANLYGIGLEPHRLAGGMAHVEHLARSLKTAGETRTMDQLRADVVMDLLEGTGVARKAGRGAVVLHSDVATLAHLAEMPGELGGYGPVIADIARQVAERQPDAEWSYVVTDPVTGDIVDVGITGYRPTASQRREVLAAYQRCVFPGCRMPSAECDLDHRVPRADRGPTATPNLGPLCRHDHVIRPRESVRSAAEFGAGAGSYWSAYEPRNR